MKKIIKEILTKYVNQNNRCGAFPIYYQILDYEYAPSYGEEYDWDRKSYSFDGEFFNTIEDIADYLECDVDKIKDLDAYDLEHDFNVETFYQCKVKKLKGFFLTEEEADEHLISNNYHYTKDAVVYGNVMWRSPETEKLLKSLINYFGIEQTKTNEHKQMTATWKWDE